MTRQRTSPITASLKLLAETFPWQSGSVFAYTQDNHTSVLGMRAIATAAGATARCVIPRATDAKYKFDHVPGVDQEAAGDAIAAPCLFVYPAESNLTGVCYDPRLAAHVAAHGIDDVAREWFVCVDAAKACGTGPPDARRCAADAFVLSYYKVCGHVMFVVSSYARCTSFTILVPTDFWLSHRSRCPGGQAHAAVPALQALRRRGNGGGGPGGHAPCTVRCMASRGKTDE